MVSPACIAGSIPTCLAAGLQGGWYPSMSCRSPSPHPVGKLRGLAWGGDLQAHTQGGVRGLPGGVSRPTLEGGGSPGPHLGGVSKPHQRGVSQHALRQTPLPDGYYCGRYASYWNAFLLKNFFPISGISLTIVYWSTNMLKSVWIKGFWKPLVHTSL